MDYCSVAVGLGGEGVMMSPDDLHAGHIRHHEWGFHLWEDNRLPQHSSAHDRR